MKYILYFLSGFALFFCTVPDMELPVEEPKESCDYSICEEGRVSTDTVEDVYGVLRLRNELYYIEVTGSAPEPDTLFLSCIAPLVELPETGGFVRISGFIKDPCSNSLSTHRDSLSLQSIEAVHPSVQQTCETQIVAGGFDNSKIDEKLHILHLGVVDSCLQILVSYTGGCDRLPEFALHYSGDIKFGGEVDVRLQGIINNDCDREHYALLRYDLAPLREMNQSNLLLFFISQGYLRVGVSFDWLQQ